MRKSELLQQLSWECQAPQPVIMLGFLLLSGLSDLRGKLADKHLNIVCFLYGHGERPKILSKACFVW